MPIGTFAAMVFPTPVGVFLDMHTDKTEAVCLPHARGGVSSRASI